MIRIRTFPPKSAVARSRNLHNISPCWNVYFDSLNTLSISFSSQLKTCHQARQTYEINLLESYASASVHTSYFKAIVSRHALARLHITRQLDKRYTNTTIASLTIPCVSFLDGCLEVFVFLLEALCVCQGPGNGKPGCQHLLCTPDPAVHL